MRGRRLPGLVLAIALVALLQNKSRATICATDLCIRLEPAELMIVEGGFFSVDVFADINAPVVGWGFDLAATPGLLLALNGTPTIGPNWNPAGSSDGDGLAGLAFPNSVTGSNVLLATMHFQAIAEGDIALTIETTIGDLTEGFALDPGGFGSFTVSPANIIVVPEPTFTSLFAFLLSAGLIRRRGGNGGCRRSKNNVCVSNVPAPTFPTIA